MNALKSMLAFLLFNFLIPGSSAQNTILKLWPGISSSLCR
jgi:hypothetical protein